MSKMKETAVRAVGRAKATASRARRKGEQLATQLAKKEVVKQTGKGVAQVRNRAAVLAREGHRRGDRTRAEA